MMVVHLKKIKMRFFQLQIIATENENVHTDFTILFQTEKLVLEIDNDMNRLLDICKFSRLS